MLQDAIKLSGTASRALVLAGALALLAACTNADERAQGHLVAGQALMAKGDAEAAANEFRKALQQKKDFSPALRGLAQVEEQRRNWPALAAVLRLLIEGDPADVDSRLKLGRLLLLAGEAEAAIPIVTPVSEGEKPSAAAIALKANILLKQKDTAGAVAEAHRALSIEPDNVEAAQILAGESLGRGDTPGALAWLSKAKVTPDAEVSVGILKAMIYERAKDTVRLEPELRRLAQLQPKSFRPALVRFLAANGRESEAETELRVAAAADPSDAEALMNVVRYLMSKGRADAAEQELQARIKAGGNVFDYQLALAELKEQQGQHGPATQILEQLATSAAPEQKYKAQLRLAALHLQKRTFAAADPVIASLLKTDSRNPDALRLRAISRIEQGQPDLAVADLREALNAQPQSAQLMQLLATAMERTGSIELAEKYYADAMRASQFNAAIGLEYARFLERRGGADQVDRVLTEVASRNPTDVRVLTALGQAKLANRDWAGAQAVADAVQRLGTQSGPVAAMIRAEALRGLNKPNESLQALQAASQASPEAVQPMRAMVRAYLQAKKPDEAEKYLEGVLAKDPANAHALVQMASVQLARNAPEQALRVLQTAIERQPRNPVGYDALAQLYARQNKLDAAMQAVRDGLAQQPDSFELRLTKGAIFIAKKDFEGAIAELEALLAKYPNSLVVANDLASLLSDHRTDAASLERAQALGAMLRKSEVPAFKETLGWLSYHRGDYKTAISLLEEAVSIMPNVAQVRYHLGMSYLKAGQIEKAREQLQKAAEYDTGMLQDKIKAALNNG